VLSTARLRQTEQTSKTHFTQAFQQSLPHLAAPTILLILILSVIDLALCSAYGNAVAHVPLEYVAKEDHVLGASNISVP